MREILFRGKALIENKWVYGDLIQMQDRVLIHQWERGCRVSYDVDGATIDQFIGLVDINDRKIFEGDIIRHYNVWNDPEAYDIGCIYYDEVHCKWRRTKTDDVDKFNPEIRKNSKYEVIGNIHDNKELLHDCEV